MDCLNFDFLMNICVFWRKICTCHTVYVLLQAIDLHNFHENEKLFKKTLPKRKTHAIIHNFTRWDGSLVGGMNKKSWQKWLWILIGGNQKDKEKVNITVETEQMVAMEEKAVLAVTAALVLTETVHTEQKNKWAKRQGRCKKAVRFGKPKNTFRVRNTPVRNHRCKEIRSLKKETARKRVAKGA